MKRSLTLIVFCLLLGGTVFGADLSVQDDTGRTVTLAAPARRVISLAPHLTEMLYAIGAGERVVGAVEYSDYPEAARQVKRVGGYSRLDLEAIVALKPDLIVAWHSGNPSEQLQRLRDFGFTLYLSEPKRIDDVAANMARLGALTGVMASADQAVSVFRQRHAALQQRYSRRPPLQVFYQLWNQPLMTMNGKHLISDVLGLCGGVNVFSDLPLLTPAIDVEAVLAADPEVIVASGMDAARPEWLEDWRRWPALSAVRHDNLYFIPPDIIQRHSPRILDGAERLCQILERVRGKQGRGAG